ncbi:partial Arginine--tRNA ligase, partial [Patescibacteria group bacterium]
MDINESIKTKILEYLNAKGLSSTEVILDTPKDSTHGDLTTNIALQVAKQLQKAPIEVAKEITDLFAGNSQIDKVEVAGPGFLNFHLNKSLVKEVINTIIESENFGTSDWGKGQTWLIEHTSPNPNKAMHLGHLRNNVTGMA